MKHFENTLTIRYDELSLQEEEYLNSLSDATKNQMISQNDCSFETHILTSTKPGDIIEINYDNYSFKVVGKYEIPD